MLTNAVDAFYLSEAFDEAQDAGIVPYDEALSPTMVWRPDGSGRMVQNAMDADARATLWAIESSGQLPAAMPDLFITRDEASGAVYADAFLGVAPDRYLVTQTRVRDFRFRGLSAGEIAEQLTMIELADQARSWLAAARSHETSDTCARRWPRCRHASTAEASYRHSAPPPR